MLLKTDERKRENYELSMSGRRWVREASLKVNGGITLAVVSGRMRGPEKIKSGEVKHDSLKLACPGYRRGGTTHIARPGCKTKGQEAFTRTTECLNSINLKKTFVKELYSNVLGDVGANKAHELTYELKNRVLAMMEWR